MVNLFLLNNLQRSSFYHRKCYKSAYDSIRLQKTAADLNVNSVQLINFEITTYFLIPFKNHWQLLKHKKLFDLLFIWIFMKTYLSDCFYQLLPFNVEMAVYISEYVTEYNCWYFLNIWFLISNLYRLNIVLNTASYTVAL